MRREHRCLPFKPEYRSVNVGLFRPYAHIVGKISRWEIIRTIHHDVVVVNQRLCVFTGEPSLVQAHFYVWVSLRQAVAR